MHSLNASFIQLKDQHNLRHTITNHTTCTQKHNPWSIYRYKIYEGGADRFISATLLLCRLLPRIKIDTRHRESKSILGGKVPRPEVVSSWWRHDRDVGSLVLTEEDEHEAMNANRGFGSHVLQHLFPCNSIHPPTMLSHS